MPTDPPSCDELASALGAHRPLILRPAGLVRAAVLIPMYEDAQGLGFVLTRRTDGLTQHAGEVSFPGGRVDDGDADAVAAALREAEEEVGLRPRDVEILGCLDDRPTVTGFVISPVAARIPADYGFRPNNDEVASIIRASAHELLTEGVHRTELWERGDGVLHVHYYELSQATVWGATARMLYELLSLPQPTQQSGLNRG